MGGATTAVYILGFAPSKIIQFLLDSYQSFYPGHIFNWTNMVKTSGRCDTPQERIEHLLFVHQTYFPERSIALFIRHAFLNSQSIGIICSTSLQSLIWPISGTNAISVRVGHVNACGTTQALVSKFGVI